ncbi:sodium-potassium ATPase [Rhizoctonia solani]|nr:sodium-potassium ATPase [Rhizoctonia solani]
MVPLPTRTLTLPPEEPNDSHQARHTHVSRQLSRVSSRSIGSPIDPAARLPVEFRTLSLHVDETARQEAAEKRKGTAKELSDLTFHTQTEEEILALFSVSPTVGLDSAQAQRRLATNGPNALSPPPSRTFRKILEWIFGGFGSLLLAASVVCFIAWKPLGEPNPAPANLALAVVLLIVLLLNAVFNMWQDISTTRTLASLTSLLPSAVTVLRDGQPTVTEASQLVTGDIVMLGTGVRVPADMRILKTEGLMVDRGVLTGESEPIPATTHYTDENFLETRNIALQGTYCVSGSGIGVVVQVGDGTVFGRIARLSTGPSANGKNGLTAGLTTLQREILRFVLIIAGCASAVAILIVVLWAAWLRRVYPDYINIPTLLIDVVSVMVAFIPEGLPVAITMSLAKVAHTLSKKKVLCKSLSIVETLGSVNVLCSDKTGTLTQNKMAVQDVAIFDTEYTVMEFRDAANKGEGNHNLHQMGAVAAVCNSANFASGTEEDPTSVRKVLGDATDSAILRFAHAMRPIETARSAWEDVFKLNFSSKTKFMLKLSKLVDLSSGSLPAPLVRSDEFNPQTDYLLTVKGAPDVLYPRCTSIMSPVDGQIFDLTPGRLAQITEVQNRWAARGRRVLMLGRRIVRGSDFKGPISDETIAEVNWNITIIGLVGLIDPLKEDIIETVRVCRGAGIRFFMVTGDHPATAVAIAAQAGIVSGNPDAIHRLSDLDSSLDEKSVPQYDPEAKDHSLFASDSNIDPEKSGSNLASSGMKSIVITGADLMMISSSQMEQLCQYDEIVFARTSPEQKLRIVHEFQRRGGVVAMTGDGVNDAPSLKAADCGIAMGDGSDVAREAADMVLLENFEAIVVALEYGRLVYDNLKKTVLYLLPAGSFSELMPILLNILIGVPQMLSSLQMIIICVGTDVLPALSLALEKPEQGLLSRRPRNVKTDRLADWKLLLHAYGFIGVLESLCAMSMSFWYLQRNGVPFSDLVLGFGNWPTLDSEKLNKAQSVYFFTLVIMQWGNLLATRSRKLSIFQHKPSGNWYIFPAMICALVIGIFFSYVPFFQKTFLTRGVPVEHYFLPVAFGFGLLLLDEARKYIVRSRPSGLLAKLAW